MTFSSEEMERARRAVEAQKIREAKDGSGRAQEDRGDADAGDISVIRTRALAPGVVAFGPSAGTGASGNAGWRLTPRTHLFGAPMSPSARAERDLKEEQNLPEELAVDAFHGWRWARLQLGPDGWPALRSLHHDRVLHPEELAACLVPQRSTTPITSAFSFTFFFGGPTAPCNDAPGPKCTCGFYAVEDRSRLRHKQVVHPDPQTGTLVVEVEVELSGRLIVHEKGVRGQHQRILGVHLSRRCTGAWLCPNPAEVVNFDASRAPRISCRKCAGKRRRIATAAQLSNVLGIEVTWEDPW